MGAGPPPGRRAGAVGVRGLSGHSPLPAVDGPRPHPPSAVQTCRLPRSPPATCVRCGCQPRPHLVPALRFALRFPLRSCLCGLLSHSRAGWPPRADLVQASPQPHEVGTVTPLQKRKARHASFRQPRATLRKCRPQLVRPASHAGPTSLVPCPLPLFLEQQPDSQPGL